MTFGKQVAKGHDNQYVTIEGLAWPEVIFDPGCCISELFREADEI